MDDHLKSVVVFSGLVLWAGSVWAGPAVIAEARVEAFVMPSKEARVAAELGRGAPVCVLDATNHSGVLARRQGWLAIRLPGGVGYVPAEAVDLTAAAPEVRDCGAPASEPADPDAPQRQSLEQEARPHTAQAAARAPRPPTNASETPETDRPALTVGGFIPLNPVRLVFGMGTGMAWLNKRSAGQNHFDDSGLTFNGTLGLVIWDVITISGAYSGAFPADHASFDQEVVPVTGGGDPRTADSSLLLNSFSIAAGLRTPFWALGSTKNGWVGASVFGEYGTAAITGTRTIEHCVDCRKDALGLSGGTLWRVGIDLLVPGRKPTFSWGVTASYQRYAEGAGFSDEFRIGFTGWVHSGRGRRAAAP